MHYKVINSVSAFYGRVGMFVRAVPYGYGYGEDIIINIDGNEYAFFLSELSNI